LSSRTEIPLTGGTSHAQGTYHGVRDDFTFTLRDAARR
jgi:hypothetical protein